MTTVKEQAPDRGSHIGQAEDAELSPPALLGSDYVQEKTTNPTDSLSLSRSSGGISNTKLEPWNPTFKELCEEFRPPPDVGEKDGSYFVRGPCIEGQSTRSDANIAPAGVVILDGDKSYDPETGEITEGAPVPAEVHEALKKIGITHCLFTTYSHSPDADIQRFRVVIPAHTKDKGELTGVLEWIFHRLAAHECHLVNVRENRSWSQAWYFPRLSSKASKYLCLFHGAGEIFDTEAALKWYEDQKVFTLEAPELEKTNSTPRPRDPNSAYAKFNAQHGTPKWMLQTLKGNGYTLQSTSLDDNDERMFRLLSPHSTSGSPGIVLFHGDDGVWRVFSHHNEKEPLSRDGDPVKVCDAFDLFRILEHGGKEHEALEAWNKLTDIRPVIRISGGQVAPNLTAAVKALAGLNPPVIFQRDKNLARVAHLDEATETEGCSIPQGTGIIVVFQRAVLTVELSKAIRWEKYKKGHWHQANPCPQVVGALLEGVGMWQGIPILTAISETPILRDDGSVLAEPGYDAATKLYVEGGSPAITLPDRITKKQAKKAAKKLLSPFSEFPFVSLDLDHSVMLAYILTLALRAQLSIAPLFCISATSPGTGKGLLVEVANLVVRGRDAATMPPIQGAGGEEEMRKRLSAVLLHGITSANFDNCSKTLGGDALNTMLTATEWVDRGLGTLNSLRLPNKITLAATGNNMSVRGDSTRRSLAVLLDAKAERPELRTFAEKDLPGYVLRHRAELLTALFTILKGYQQAGNPGASDNPLGRFEQWSAAVCGPIRWLGYPDPVDSQARLRELDPEAEKLGVLMCAWSNLLGKNWQVVADVIGAIEPVYPEPNQTQKDALRTVLREIAPEARDQISSRLLGWFLKHHNGRIIDNYRLERKPRLNSKSKKPQQYRVIENDPPDDN
jgi:hypothetical protein